MRVRKLCRSSTRSPTRERATDVAVRIRLSPHFGASGLHRRNHFCFSSRDVGWQRALEEFRQFDWPATLNRFAVAFSWNSVTALPVTSLIVLVFWLPFCPEFQSGLGTKLRDWDNRILRF